LDGDVKDMSRISPRAWVALGSWGVVASSAGLLVAQGAGCAGRLDLGTISDRDVGPSPSREGGLAVNSFDDAAVGTFQANGDDAGSENGADAGGASSVAADSASNLTMPVPSGLASFDFDSTTPVPPGLAGFAFVVNDVVQRPMACPSDNWEYSANSTPSTLCNIAGTPPCVVGVQSVYLVNTGQVPVAYIAAGWWSGSGGYVPGVATGESNQLVGVLDPGAKADITSVYNAGVVAILGSSDPFSSPDAGKYESDEGSIPWPAGVAGSQGSSTMWIAEIEVRPSCTNSNKTW
jgi:hypothetical protein